MKEYQNLTQVIPSREIKLPEGVIRYRPFSEDENEKQIEASYGISWIKERMLDMEDLQYYESEANSIIGSKDWKLLQGTRFRLDPDERIVVMLGTNISVGELNQIVKLSYHIDLALLYYDFTGVTVKETRKAFEKTGYSIRAFETAKKANPELFDGESSLDVLDSLNQTVSKNIADMGVVFDKLIKSQSDIEASINENIEKLYNLGVVSIDRMNSGNQGMYWPIGRYIRNKFDGKLHR